MVGKTRLAGAFSSACVLAVGATLLATALAFAVAICLAPHAAFAANEGYRVLMANIEVQMQADGSLTVREYRTYQFPARKGSEGWTDAVEWLIPRDSANGVEVEAVPTATNSDFTIEQSDNVDAVIALVNIPKTANRLRSASLYYTVNGAVTKWGDCVELNWRYADASLEGRTWPITCTIKTPAGEGAPANAPISAWSHHPLFASTLDVEENAISIYTPSVRDGSFEVRAVLPADAFVDMPAQPQDKAAEITAQEEALVAEQMQPHISAFAAETSTTLEGGTTSESVTTSLIPIIAVVVIGWGIVIALVVITITRAVRYRKEHRASFDDKYWNEAPAPLHPALLDYIWDGASGGAQALAASLMRLDRLGALRVEVADVVSRDPEWVMEFKNVKIELVPESVAGLEDLLDQAAARFIKSISLEKPSGMRSQSKSSAKVEPITLRSLTRLSELDGAAFVDIIDEWNCAVDAAVSKSGISTEAGSQAGKTKTPKIVDSPEARNLRRKLSVKAAIRGLFSDKKEDEPINLGCAFLLALVLIVPSSFFALLVAFWDFLFSPTVASRGLTIPFVALPFALLAACIAFAWSLRRQWGLSSDAVEIRAKMAALKAWLLAKPEDQGRVPSDADTWAAIMESAIVMGVSDKAFEVMDENVSHEEKNAALKSAYRWCKPPNPASKSLAVRFQEAYNNSKRSLT